MGILILPGQNDRTPERGAGLDRDGPPGRDAVEGYCVAEFHDRTMPRRFDWVAGMPPTVCPHCREFMTKYHKKAQAGLVPMGNRMIKGGQASQGAPARKW